MIVSATAVTFWDAEISGTEIAHRREALGTARMALDGIKRQAASNFDLIKKYTADDPFYQTTVTIIDLDLYTKQVKVVVSWQTQGTARGQVELTAVVTDRRAALSGSTCLASPGGGLPVVNSNLVLSTANGSTGVVVRNHLAYVTTNSSVLKMEDFFVVDVTDPLHPTTVSKLHTGPGLMSIAVSGNNAFVANASINGQMQIIDISNPVAPILKSSYKLPGHYTDNATVGNVIAYSNNRVYLGTQKSQIAEFHVIDVTNPVAPVELGSYEIGAGINAIMIVGQNAYVASPSSEELKILDVSNPASIRQASGFDAPGGSGNGKSLAILDDLVFLGRTVGGKELYVLQYSGPQMTELSERNLDTSTVNVTAVPSWLFMATTDTAKSLQIWNTEDPANPTLAKSLGITDKITALACGRDKLYLATSNGLTIITP